MIVERLPITLELAALSVLIGLMIGIPAGILAAVRRGFAADYTTTSVALVGISIPNFFLGLILILVFAVHLQWLPASGYVPFFEDPIENLKRMIMPAFVLGTGLAAVVMRQVRSSMLEALGADYVRTARAKGLSEPVVVGVHALRNSLITVVTLVGLQMGALISGAVVTETIFVIPGFGKLTVDAIFERDFPLIQGVVLVAAAGYVVVNLIVDLALFADQSAHPDCGEERVTTVQPGVGGAELVARAPRVPRRRILLRRFLRRPLAVVSLAIVLAFVLAAVFAPVLAPYDPDATDFDALLRLTVERALARHGRARTGRLSRASSSARAPRCWRASSPQCSRWRSPSPSASSRGTTVAGPTP